MLEGRCTDTSGLRIAVVVARFNDLVTAKLLTGCLDCLHLHGVDITAESSQLDEAWLLGVAPRCSAVGPLGLLTVGDYIWCGDSRGHPAFS